MGRVGVYFLVAAVIISLTLLGQLPELKARSHTSAAIKSLLNMSLKMTRRLNDDGSDEDVPISHVHVHDRLSVLPGEKVLIDGVVAEGNNSFNESILTGEPSPVTKRQGDRLIGLTVNTNGTLIMRCDRVGSETEL